MAEMQPVEIGRAATADELLTKFVQATDMNAILLKDFVSDVCGNPDLLAWAKELCAVGEPVTDQLCYYEGHESKPGESFRDQLQRQLQDDLQTCGQDLDRASVSAELADGSPGAVKALMKLFDRLMQLLDLCIADGGREEMRWKLKIEVNQDGACTKFHDDNVKVRFALVLAGDGTVLHDNSKVDWDFYTSCEGVIPALAEDPDLTPEKARKAILQWNQKVGPTQPLIRTQRWMQPFSRSQSVSEIRMPWPGLWE